jgi:AraC-like DNA-binding protein
VAKRKKSEVYRVASLDNAAAPGTQAALLGLNASAARVSPPTRTGQCDAGEDKIGRLLIFGMAHAGDFHLTLGVAAQNLHVSAKHLGKLFKARAGVSFHQWLRTLRMQLAADLLSEGSLRVKEIAARIGYGDASNFATDFRAWSGVSPRVYARSRGNPAPRSHETA